MTDVSDTFMTVMIINTLTNPYGLAFFVVAVIIIMIIIVAISGSSSSSNSSSSSTSSTAVGTNRISQRDDDPLYPSTLYMKY